METQRKVSERQTAMPWPETIDWLTESVLNVTLMPIMKTGTWGRMYRFLVLKAAQKQWIQEGERK